MGKGMNGYQRSRKGKDIAQNDGTLCCKTTQEKKGGKRTIGKTKRGEKNALLDTDYVCMKK